MKSMFSGLSGDLHITFGSRYFYPKSIGVLKLQDIRGGVERWASPLKSFKIENPAPLLFSFHGKILQNSQG